MISSNPLVSIVVPTHNRAHLIPRAVDSIINQTYKNWELFVVDDASTDNSAEIMKQYEQYPNINYIRLTENKGACNARNIGIQKSAGKYVTFLDSDDEYLPAKVERQVAYLESKSDVGVVVVSCGREDVRDGKKYLEWIPEHRGDIMERLLGKGRIGAGTPFLMVKREVLVNNNILFDPQMPASQDWDFLVQVCQHGLFDFVPEILVRVYHHTEERVYNPARAMKALTIQYSKYQHLFDKYPKARRGFILRQAIMCYNYGNRAEAMKLLTGNRVHAGMQENLWLQYFKLFPARKSFLSKALFSVMSKLSSNE